MKKYRKYLVFFILLSIIHFFINKIPVIGLEYNDFLHSVIFALITSVIYAFIDVLVAKRKQVG